MPLPIVKPGKSIVPPIKNMKELKFNASFFKGTNLTDKEKVEFLKVCKFIEENCSTFLKYSKENKKFLYRGSKDDYKTYSLNRSRNNRKPIDSSLKAQRECDKSLLSQGFKALRGNSIFCSSDYNHASNYGNVRVIFPVNGFNFSWSKKHKDLVLYDEDFSYYPLKKLLNKIGRKLGYIIGVYYSDEIPEKIIHILIDIKNDWIYANMDYFLLSDIKKSLTKYDAICKKYPIFNVITPVLRQQIEDIFNAPKKSEMDKAKEFCFKNKMDRKDLTGALKCGNEVYINGLYVAVDEDLLSLLKKYFFGAK
jgi:hypothetical protein